MNQELEALIEDQRKDAATNTIWPEAHGRITLVPLNEEVAGDSNGGLPTMRSDKLVGVTFDFDEMIEEGDYEMEGEVSSFIPPYVSHGHWLRQIPHGTSGGYSNYGCRCALCSAANSAVCLSGRKRRTEDETPEHVHGTTNGYSNYGCRCEPCTKAHSAVVDAWRVKKGRKRLTAEQKAQRAERQRERRQKYTPGQIEQQRAADRERKRRARMAGTAWN